VERNRKGGQNPPRVVVPIEEEEEEEEVGGEGEAGEKDDFVILFHCSNLK